jgi:hypothetical protein
MYTVFVYQNWNNKEFNGFKGLYFTKWGANKAAKQVVRNSPFMYRCVIDFDKNEFHAFHVKDKDFDFAVIVTKLRFHSNFYIGHGEDPETHFKAPKAQYL